ncbi:hypothetical protein TNCV_1174211 [Trichonephila clavipes]|nr:hypothetical protein TNCV_1174211 [Trichonephila clavipes]
MEPSRNSPSVEQQVVSEKNDIPSHTQRREFSDSARFFVLKTPNTFSTVSPFLIEKAITSSIGRVKTIRKMRSGDLFLEVASAKQSSAIRTLRKMAHIDVTIVPHNTLNYSRGVISAADLLNVSTEEIKENMVDQKVCEVRRITIRRDGQVLNTKHLILTFSTPELPQSVKAAYLHCPVRPYIPNPLQVGHDSADCKAKERCVNCKGDHSSFSRSCPTWILEKEITAVKIKNKLSYPEARRVVSLRTPVSGKSYASAANKTYQTIAIQVDASTAPKSAQSESVQPKSIAVDTRKTVSTPPTVKKTRKTRIKDSGVQSHKKKRSNFSKKLHDMVDDVMDIHASQSDESLNGRSVAQTFVFWLLAREQVRRLHDLLISWNCRGLRTRLADLKSIISTYQPACVALQETFLKSTMTMQVRGYNCVRRDVDGDTSPNGGVCLFTSNLFPSNVVTLHTSLQAVAVRIHIHSLVTVCCVYLPPNDVVPQVDLNHLVRQLPAPFILLGDFNGHSPLWGHDVTNSRGRQIEQLISDHCLCLLNNDEKTYFHAPTRTFHSLDLAICSPTLLPMLNFEVANDLHNSDHFPLLVSHVNGAGSISSPHLSFSSRRLG